jgi:hypothetical protein
MKMTHQDRISRAAQFRPDIFKPGSISVTVIAHDEDCAIFGEKECSCDPDIMSEVNGVMFTIDPTGNVFQNN